MPRGLSDYDSAVIQGRLWTPEVLRPDAWFDAADLSTITIATGVSEWRDKSGNERHMTQATAGVQPPLDLETKNGLACIRFRFQNTGGTESDNLAMSASLNVRSAYCVLYRQSGIPTYSNNSNFIFTDPVNYNWHASPGNLGALAWSSVPETANWRGSSNFASGSSITVSTYIGQDIWNVFSLNSSGNQVTRGIGKDRASFHSSKGLYGEVLFFTSASPTRERWLIEGYLSWKWGIPLAADHPYANRPPLIGD
jgi:hypothetical protein